MNGSGKKDIKKKAWKFFVLRMKNMTKSICWVTLAFFFGSIQLLLVLIGNSIYNFLPIDINQILIDGSVLFFSSAIVATIVIDYYFTESLSLSKSISGFYYGLIPLIIFIVNIFLFASFLSIKNAIAMEGRNIYEICNIQEIKNIEFAIVITVGIYAFISKYIQFENIAYKKSSEKSSTKSRVE